MRRERLQLSRDLHGLCAKRLDAAGPGISGLVEPMQQISAWQDKLQRDLVVCCTVLWILPLPHTLHSEYWLCHAPESCREDASWLE